MASFPFFPYRNYYNYYPKHYNPNISPNKSVSMPNVQANSYNRNKSLECKTGQDFQNIKTENNATHESKTKEKSSRYSFGPISFNSSSLSDTEEPILEVLGIKLYLDDLIILGLLFFLYQEGVKDENLFISLILLLLS